MQFLGPENLWLPRLTWILFTQVFPQVPKIALKKQSIFCFRAHQKKIHYLVLAARGRYNFDTSLNSRTILTIKKSAALILSVLLPFSPTPRLWGSPFDKKHKDPKGAGGVKKCNGLLYTTHIIPLWLCGGAGIWDPPSAYGHTVEQKLI